MVTECLQRPPITKIEFVRRQTTANIVFFYHTIRDLCNDNVSSINFNLWKIKIYTDFTDV